MNKKVLGLGLFGAAAAGVYLLYKKGLKVQAVTEKPLEGEDEDFEEDLKALFDDTESEDEVEVRDNSEILKKDFQEIASILSEDAIKAAKTVAVGFGAAADDFKDICSDYKEDPKAFREEYYQKAKNKATELKDKASEKFEDVKTFAGERFEDAKEKAAEFKDKAKDFADEKLDAFKEHFTDAEPEAEPEAEEIVEEVAETGAGEKS